MKIAINALSARQGGGVTYIANIIRYFPAEGYEGVVLAGEYNAEAFRKAAASRPNVRIEVVSLPEKAIFRRTLWEIFFLPGYLKKEHFDVYYAPGGIMLTLLPRGIVAATALQNMRPWSMKLNRRCGRPFRERLRHWVYRRLFLLSYRLADKVVFISRHSMECVEKYDPAVRRKAALIPHGLDGRFLAPAAGTEFLRRENLRPGEYYLYVSQYNFYKSQKEVIRDWEFLEQADFPYPLVLAGRITDTSYGRECARLITEKKLEGSVRTIDRIAHDEMPGFLQNARAVIFASACECCPIVLLEKMSSGRPVFCDTLPPMPEFGGKSLYYFDLYKPGDLARAILEAERNPAEMESRAKETRNFAAAAYRWPETIRKTLDFFTGKEPSGIQHGMEKT